MARFCRSWVILGVCWVALRSSWVDLDGPGGGLGSFLGALGPSWCDLGGSGAGSEGEKARLEGLQSPQ